MHTNQKLIKSRLAAMSYSELLDMHERYQEKDTWLTSDEIFLDLLANEIDARETQLTEHRRNTLEEDYGSFDCVH